MATTIAAAGALAIPLSHHAPAEVTGPRPPSTTATEATMIAPRVVVYSVPDRSSKHGSGSHSDGDHGGGGHAGSNSDTGGSSSDGDAHNLVAPQVLDGPSGSDTVTNTNPSATTTITNGGASSAPIPAPTGTSSGSATLAAPPAGVFPPLQTESGTPQTTAPQTVGPQVGGTLDGSATTPGTQTPTVAPLGVPAALPPTYNSLPQTNTALPTAAPAQMLVQVQCPAQMPTASLCLEAISDNGTAASLPPTATQTLPNLPLQPTPGSPGTNCPATGAAPATNDGGSGSSSAGSGGDGSEGSGADTDGSGHSGGGKHHSSHKGKGGGDHAKDSADVLPIGQPDGSGSGTPTLASCGLVNQAGSALDQVGAGTGTALGSVGASVSGAGGMVDAALKPAGERKTIPTGTPKQTQIRTTGYSFQDNTPPNSNKISCGTIHSVAGGVGTYDDPITVAVPGHDGQGAQLSCGTRIYYPDYKFYGIVEDTGATDFAGQTHTDIYVDGATNANGGGGADSPAYSKSQSDKCMDPVTKNSVPAIVNPPPNEPVRKPGPITQGSQCDVGGSSGGTS